jgi:hypothetical protein
MTFHHWMSPSKEVAPWNMKSMALTFLTFQFWRSELKNGADANIDDMDVTLVTFHKEISLSNNCVE